MGNQGQVTEEHGRHPSGTPKGNFQNSLGRLDHEEIQRIFALRGVNQIQSRALSKDSSYCVQQLKPRKVLAEAD